MPDRERHSHRDGIGLRKPGRERDFAIPSRFRLVPVSSRSRFRKKFRYWRSPGKTGINGNIVISVKSRTGRSFSNLWWPKHRQFRDFKKITIFLGLHRIWLWPDLPDSDFAGFQIFKSGNLARYPVGTILPDYPAGLPDLTKINFETFQDKFEIFFRDFF